MNRFFKALVILAILSVQNGATYHLRRGLLRVRKASPVDIDIGYGTSEELSPAHGQTELFFTKDFPIGSANDSEFVANLLGEDISGDLRSYRDMMLSSFQNDVKWDNSSLDQVLLDIPRSKDFILSVFKKSEDVFIPLRVVIATLLYLKEIPHRFQRSSSGFVTTATTTYLQGDILVICGLLKLNDLDPVKAARDMVELKTHIPDPFALFAQTEFFHQKNNKDIMTRNLSMTAHTLFGKNFITKAAATAGGGSIEFLAYLLGKGGRSPSYGSSTRTRRNEIRARYFNVLTHAQKLAYKQFMKDHGNIRQKNENFAIELVNDWLLSTDKISVFTKSAVAMCTMRESKKSPLKHSPINVLTTRLYHNSASSEQRSSESFQEDPLCTLFIYDVNDESLTKQLLSNLIRGIKRIARSSFSEDQVSWSLRVRIREDFPRFINDIELQDLEGQA